MPLLGLIDPSHTERKADEPGRVPRWYTTEELLLQASEASPKWSPWPYELINAALDEWQERDYISTTMLVGGCGRSKVIERKEDFILALDDLWAAFRGCVTPDTPVLTSELSWVPAGKLQEGDELLGFDDSGKFATSRVIANEPLHKLVYTVETDQGTVTASEDHPWRVVGSYKERERVAAHGRPRRKSKDWAPGRAEWVMTKDLIPGDRIMSVPMWDFDESREAGYLAAAYDGEGHYDCAGRLSFVQKPGQVLDRVEAALVERGFTLERILRSTGVAHTRVAGGKLETLRALGTLGPSRLIAQAQQRWSSWDVAKTTQRAIVTRILKGEVQEVAGLETSTRTYIAGGLLSHNTMIHRTLEHGARPGSVAEARFFTTVRIPKAGKVEVSCSPDLVTQRPVAVVDYKAPTDDRSIPMYGYPWRNHIDQLQFNRYIINHAEKWELQEEHMDLPWNPRDLVFEHLYVVYLGSRGPKVIECQKSVEVVFKNGGKGNRKYPDIWSDIQVEDELVPRLTGMVKALAAYPEWPDDLEKYPGFEGPPGWKCPGRPWCALPNCVAKRWPDGLAWEQPPLRQKRAEVEEEEE